MSLPWPWHQCPHAHRSWHCLCAFPCVLEPTCSTLGGDSSMAVKLIMQPGARRGSGGAGTVLCHQPHRDPSPTWPGQGSFLNCCCKTLPVQAPEKMYKYCWALMVLREWSCPWGGSRLWLGLQHGRSQGKCSRGCSGRCQQYQRTESGAGASFL